MNKEEKKLLNELIENYFKMQEFYVKQLNKVNTNVELLMAMFYKFTVKENSPSFKDFYENFWNNENKQTVTVRSKDGSFENTYDV